jgi:Carboxypeptidase regulatory-like domain
MAARVRGQRSGRLALAACLVLLGSLASVPAASAAEQAVAEGTVTSASTHAGIDDVEVRFYYGSNGYYKSETSGSGSYAGALPAGEYLVEFVPKAPYAFQYYKDAQSPETATRVLFREGEHKPLDAELAQGNSISGTVTSAASGDELPTIEVTLYEAKAPNSVVATTTTNEHGGYEIATLPKGEYLLGFKASFLTSLNVAPQFYEDRPRFDEASTLHLTEGQHVAISPKLTIGGSISGVVTDAVTHAPVSGVSVLAFTVGGKIPTSVALTSSNGEYTLPGLGDEEVVVYFALETKETAALYQPQLYDGREVPSDLAEGELFLLGSHVDVTAGVATTGIDAALVRREPANTSAPLASGTPAVGQALSCTNGSWTGLPTISFAQKWLRDGAAIPGASSATYTVQAADAGHGFACEVTATNEIGSISAVSNTLDVPAPNTNPTGTTPAPTSPPVLVLSAAKISVSNAEAYVPIDCEHANCAGTIELTEQHTVKVREHGHTRSKRETVVLAKGTYALAAGRTATILLRLTATGKSALAKASHHRLSAETLATVAGGTTAKRPVTLSAAATSRPR